MDQGTFTGRVTRARARGLTPATAPVTGSRRKKGAVSGTTPFKTHDDAQADAPAMDTQKSPCKAAPALMEADTSVASDDQQQVVQDQMQPQDAQPSQTDEQDDMGEQDQISEPDEVADPMEEAVEAQLPAEQAAPGDAAKKPELAAVGTPVAALLASAFPSGLTPASGMASTIPGLTPVEPGTLASATPGDDGFDGSAGGELEPTNLAAILGWTPGTVMGTPTGAAMTPEQGATPGTNDIISQILSTPAPTPAAGMQQPGPAPSPVIGSSAPLAEGTPVFGLVTDPEASKQLRSTAATGASQAQFVLPAAPETPQTGKSNMGGAAHVATDTFADRMDAAGFGSPQDLAPQQQKQQQQPGDVTGVDDAAPSAPPLPAGDTVARAEMAAMDGEQALDGGAAAVAPEETMEEQQGAEEAKEAAGGTSSPELKVVVRTPAQPRSMMGRNKLHTSAASVPRAGMARAGGSRLAVSSSAAAAVPRPAAAATTSVTRRASAAAGVNSMPQVRIVEPAAAQGRAGQASGPLAAAMSCSPGHTPFVKDARATATHRAAASRAAAARAAIVSAAAPVSTGSAKKASPAAKPDAGVAEAASAPVRRQSTASPTQPATAAAPSARSFGSSGVVHVPSRLLAPTASSLAKTAGSTPARPAAMQRPRSTVVVPEAPVGPSLNTLKRTVREALDAKRKTAEARQAAVAASKAGAAGPGEIRRKAAAEEDGDENDPVEEEQRSAEEREQASRKREARTGGAAGRGVRGSPGAATAAAKAADDLAGALDSMSIPKGTPKAEVPLRGIPPPRGTHKRFDDAGAAVDSPQRTKLRGVPAARGAHKRFEF